jgi:hypothetical protein
MRSLAAGFAALRHGKLVLLLTASTVLIALSGVAPLHAGLVKSVGRTLAGDHFLNNAPSAAPTDAFDFLRLHWSTVTGTVQGAHVGAAFAVVLQMFFAGGIVVVLGRGPFGFGQFIEPARRNFWHNVKCFLIFAVVLASTLTALIWGANAAAKPIFEDAVPGSLACRAWDWGVAILALGVWGVLSLLYDFARAARRYSPNIGTWRAFGFARRALRGSWARALALFLFWLALGAAAWLGAFALAWTMPAASRPAIGLLLGLQCLVLGVRAAVRVATWGSYLGFLDPRAARALAPRDGSLAAIGASAPQRF